MGGEGGGAEEAERENGAEEMVELFHGGMCGGGCLGQSRRFVYSMSLVSELVFRKRERNQRFAHGTSFDERRA